MLVTQVKYRLSVSTTQLALNSNHNLDYGVRSTSGSNL